MAYRIACALAVGALTAAALVACSNPSATQTPANSQTNTGASPTTATPASTTPATGTPAAARSVSFANDVRPLLDSRCAGCHKPGGRGAADAPFVDASGHAKYDDVSAQIGGILTQVRTGQMPKVGPKLTTDEIAILEAWQANGTPNN